VKFVFIAAEKAKYPVRLLCELLEVSRSGFYASVDRPAAPKTISDAKLVVEIKAAMVRGRGSYGSPRVHEDLQAHGIRVSKKRIERLMRENELVARQKRRFVHTTDSNHEHPIAPNVLERDFEAKAPNEAWVGDVTYISTGEGWLYLAVLIDLFSRRVVGWATSASNDTELAMRALHQALRARRPLPGLVQHTDRGSPYASGDYRAVLDAHAVVPSMSRTGDCYDNAVAESFFATLKAEHVDHEDFATRDLGTASIGDYIDNFYNCARRHSYVGYLSPIEFELRSKTKAIAA
jgi:transposase InsO family protein